jgi:hypothetical protein
MSPTEKAEKIKAEGIKAIIALQKYAGITEPKERAAEAWSHFTQLEKDQTETIYRTLEKNGDI